MNGILCAFHLKSSCQTHIKFGIHTHARTTCCWCTRFLVFNLIGSMRRVKTMVLVAATAAATAAAVLRSSNRLVITRYQRHTPIKIDMYSIENEHTNNQLLIIMDLMWLGVFFFFLSSFHSFLFRLCGVFIPFHFISFFAVFLVWFFVAVHKESTEFSRVFEASSPAYVQNLFNEYSLSMIQSKPFEIESMATMRWWDGMKLSWFFLLFFVVPLYLFQMIPSAHYNSKIDLVLWIIFFVWRMK